jgi:NAD(P)-dependent dehydrogenase (short-subunit alcohol dehydrogenase family)
MSTEGLFAGQTVIVTGAGHGLGRDFALSFARHGAAVVVTDVRPADDVVAEIEAAGGRALAVTGSVAEEADVRATVDATLAEFGRIDAVVNNAGIVNGGLLNEQSAEGAAEMLAVHVVGTFLMCREVFPHMTAAGGGRLVNIASSAGLFGMRTMSSYSAAKAGIVGLTHTLAIEGSEHGIKVNAVAPLALTNPGRTEGAKEVFGALGPRARPEFVTPLVVYLASRLNEATNETFSAGAGRYARVFTGLVDGWLSPGDAPAAVTDVAAHFGEICDASNYQVLQNMREEIPIIAARLH